MYSRNHRGWRIATAASTAALLLLSGCATTTDTTNGPSATRATTGSLHDMLPTRVQDAGVLKVGITADPAPYSTTGDSGPAGFIPDLVAALGETLDIDIEFVELPFPGLIPAVQAAKVDVGWTVLNDTVERESAADMVTYLNNSSAFLTRISDELSIESMDDLCGLTVATVRGSVYIPALEEQSVTCTDAGEEAVAISQFDDGKSSLLAVQSRNADTFVGLTGVLKHLANTVDEGKSFEVAELEVFPGWLGAVVAKGSDLPAALQAALRALVEDGTYETIAARWDLSGDVPGVDEITVNGVGTGELK